MSLTGSLSYIQCSGLSNNQELVLNITSETRTIRNSVQDDFIPSASGVPNSVVGFIGTYNPSVVVRGHLDVCDHKDYELSISGLLSLMTAAKYHSIWFYDDVIYGAGSGAWVIPKNIQYTRNNTTESTDGFKGNRINYTISFVETR